MIWEEGARAHSSIPFLSNFVFLIMSEIEKDKADGIYDGTGRATVFCCRCHAYLGSSEQAGFSQGSETHGICPTCAEVEWEKHKKRKE